MNRNVDPGDRGRWSRWFAVECNNRAWRLAESTTRTAAENRQMLDAAHAAAYHWGQVGTELHRARATMLLAHVHALLGHGPGALRYARESFEYVELHDSPDWEVAFAHAVLANAAAAAGDRELHSKHYAEARALGGAMDDPEERSIFDATFRVIPVPAEGS